MADEELGDSLPPADDAFVQLPGADPAVKFLPPPPAIPGRGKPFGSPRILAYVSFAVNKKFGEKLTDEECGKLGLPSGSTMPDPETMIPLDPSTHGLPERGTPTVAPEIPSFTLDPEAELPGEEDIDHKGSTPAHHTEFEMPPLEGPKLTRTVDEVADEAKALMEAMVARGFSRAESLELVKEVVKVRAKE